MAKAKAKATKATQGASNKPANSRVKFLFEAAVLLSQQHSKSPSLPTPKTIESADLQANKRSSALTLQPLSNRLVSDLRSVSRKAQIRLSPAVKHSICKGCNTLLVEGSTCTKEIENRSRGRKKPWADVMLQKCTSCGQAKRFPLTAQRQKRRPHRAAVLQSAAETDMAKGD